MFNIRRFIEKMFNTKVSEYNCYATVAFYLLSISKIIWSFLQMGRYISFRDTYSVVKKEETFVWNIFL